MRTSTAGLILILLAGCSAAPPRGEQPQSLTPASPFIHATAGDRYRRLQIGTRLNLPDSARTVTAAIRWLLEPTGYQLVTDNYLVKRPLPPLAQTGWDAVTIEAALLRVIGGEHLLVVDDEHQRIAVEHLPANVGVTSRVVSRVLVDD